MLYLPQVRGDWTSRRSVFELTAGYQVQNQQALQQQQTVTGQAGDDPGGPTFTISLAAYRVRF